jgi:3-oxoacyl-(acyl-carrier-protein) synthase
MRERRVVVTGLGIVSSVGIGKDEFWQSIINGKSGISEVASFDTSELRCHYAGEIKNFSPEQFIPKRKTKFLGRTSQLAIAATSLAINKQSKSTAVYSEQYTCKCCHSFQAGRAELSHSHSLCCGQLCYWLWI